MNKSQASKVAKLMVKKGLSAYTGKYAIAAMLGANPKSITDTQEKKMLSAFYKEVIENPVKYPAIQVMFAEEQINGVNSRRAR